MATKINNQQGLAIVIENNVNIVEVKGDLIKSVKLIIQRTDELWDSVKNDILNYAINKKDITEIEKCTELIEILDIDTIKLCITLIKVNGNLDLIEKLREYKMTKEEKSILTIIK